MGDERLGSEEADRSRAKSLSGRFRQQVELALELGLSPRRLAGWEPTDTVRASYDDDGRLAGFTVEREPEFSDDDLVLLLALKEIHAEEAARDSEIGSHGRPMSEAMSPDFDPNNRRSARHYMPRVRVDHASRLLRMLQDARAEAFPDEDRSSLVWTLEPTAGPPPLTYFD